MRSPGQHVWSHATIFCQAVGHTEASGRKSAEHNAPLSCWKSLAHCSGTAIHPAAAPQLRRQSLFEWAPDQLAKKSVAPSSTAASPALLAQAINSSRKASAVKLRPHLFAPSKAPATFLLSQANTHAQLHELGTSHRQSRCPCGTVTMLLERRSGMSGSLFSPNQNHGSPSVKFACGGASRLAPPFISSLLGLSHLFAQAWQLGDGSGGEAEGVLAGRLAVLPGSVFALSACTCSIR